MNASIRAYFARRPKTKWVLGRRRPIGAGTGTADLGAEGDLLLVTETGFFLTSADVLAVAFGDENSTPLTTESGQQLAYSY